MSLEESKPFAVAIAAALVLTSGVLSLGAAQASTHEEATDSAYVDGLPVDPTEPGEAQEDVRSDVKGTVCDGTGDERGGILDLLGIGCVVSWTNDGLCDATVGDERPGYYTHLDCVQHPADALVCQLMGAEHHPWVSAWDCVL